MRHAVLFFVGLIFGVGLVVGGMSNPAKVVNFLDLAGFWDPSLAFVMGGALLVVGIGYRLIFGLKAPLFAEKFELPTKKDLDAPLVAGSAIFGLGWGLAGICPGPALTLLGIGGQNALAFVAAMLLGMFLARRLKPSS